MRSDGASSFESRPSVKRPFNTEPRTRAAGSLEPVQGIPQRTPQRLELLLEMSPVAHSLGIDRLAHLLGAWRTHRTRGLVLAEAGRLERQAAVFEQPADIRFRIAYQLLVLDVQDLTRQDRVPVIHQRQVAAVVPAEILEVVAEGLAGGEVLPERAEARIHRMSPCVD